MFHFVTIPYLYLIIYCAKRVKNLEINLLALFCRECQFQQNCLNSIEKYSRRAYKIALKAGEC